MNEWVAGCSMDGWIAGFINPNENAWLNETIMYGNDFPVIAHA